MNGNGGGGGGKPEQGSGGNNMTPQQKAMAANLAARRALIPGPNTQTVKMVQRIASVTNTTYTAGQALTLNFTPAPVGIIRRFYIEVTAIAGIGAAETQTRQPLGPSALVSNITYTDTSNQARVNTTGWHLHWLASIKRRTIFGAAYTSDTPTGFGSNINAISAPATMAAAPSSTNIYMVYEVPLAYAEDDLRGAVFANLINATQNLQVTINPNFFVATAADGTLAGYKSSSTQLGRLSSITVNVYQEYIDQFAGLPLPNIDLGTQYLINWTNGGLPTVNVDLVFPYANFRSYLSTIVFYDNNGTVNAGTDINYLTLRSANTTNLEYYDPMLLSALTRTRLGDDMPTGAYWVDHRHKPLLTTTYGNMSFVANVSSVGGAGANLYFYYEALALAQQIAIAGSMANNP